MKKKASPEEMAYMGRVAALGCYLSQYLGLGFVPAQVHHVGGRLIKNCHYLTVPLSEKYHANYSPDGIHGQRKAWRLAGVTEEDALAWTIKTLNEENEAYIHSMKQVRNLGAG